MKNYESTIGGVFILRVSIVPYSNYLFVDSNLYIYLIDVMYE